MQTIDHEKQAAEHDLLLAVYPDKITNDSHKSFEFILGDDNHLLVHLPANYPSTSSPEISLHSSKLSKNDHSKYLAIVAEIIAAKYAESLGEAFLIEALQECSDRFEEFTALSNQDNDLTNDKITTPTNTANKTVNVISLLWFHHLLSTTKRKFIVSESASRKLSGFSKPGYPGALILWGDQSEVHGMITELKDMRWKAIQVRDEIAMDARCKNAPVGVIEKESIGEIATNLETYGLREWFFKTMKIT